jgi:lysophospholipase L1-like esterase
MRPVAAGARAGRIFCAPSMLTTAEPMIQFDDRSQRNPSTGTGRRLLRGAALACALFLAGACLPLRFASAAATTPAWVSTWTAASQPPLPGTTDHYHGESLRLIVHISAGGSQVRVRLSNRYGDTPLTIGTARLARRAAEANIDPASDRGLTFSGKSSVVLPAHATALSDPVRLEVGALSDLAVSLYLPEAVQATTVHVLAQQTSYVSRPGDATGAASFPVARRIDSWPFLAEVQVEATPGMFAIVAFGDSLVDGDGSTADANRRWPDALAARLQHTGRNVAVLNAGLIGNRLLHDSPSDSRFGKALGESGLERFQRDALERAGIKVIIVRIGSNDLGFPNALAPKSEPAAVDDLIAGYQRLIAQAHQHGLGIIGTTIPPFENIDIPDYFTPARDAMRQQVNAWILSKHGFDAVLDFDRILRDPTHPARLLPAYDSGDHLHPNDAGYSAVAAALSLSTLDELASLSAAGPSIAERRG